MSLRLLETPGGAVAAAVVLHVALLLLPVRAEEHREPLEFIPFELAEAPALPEPAPVEPEPAEAEPTLIEPEEEPAPAGPRIEEPDRDPTRTSATSNRPDDGTPDEEVPVVTGLPLTGEQLVEGGMGVRVGNTADAGYDDPAVTKPGELGGFEGGGQGGGGFQGTAGGVDQEAVALRQSRPVYPKALSKEGQEGRVIVDVEILVNGRVGEVVIVYSSHPAFAASVEAALRRYRFRPARLDGEKVTSTVRIDFKFQLTGDEEP